MALTKDDLRRYAVARSLFAPTTLKRAVHKLGFVQADPIRAPGAGAGPDASPSRAELPRWRSRAALCGSRRPGRLLRQLRIRRRGGPGPDAPARRTDALAALARQARGGAARFRPRARRGAPARSGRSFLARDRHELLGRLVERHYASARRHALPRSAASGAARPGHPHLRRARPRARAARPRVATAAARCARGRGRPHVCAAPRGHAVVADQSSSLRRAAVAARAEARRRSARANGSRTRESTASTGIGPPPIA